MNRTEMVSAIARREKVKHAVVEAVVESFLDLLVLSISTGEEVTIRGLGRFEPKQRVSVTLRNPHNGEPIETGPRRTMVFKPSTTLKEKLNSAVPL
jgi:DNA-binding protein HU-beta